MTIGTKLYSGFGGLLGLAVLVGCTALYNGATLSGELQAARTEEAQKYLLLGTINTALSDMIAFEKGVIIRAAAKDSAKLMQNNMDFQNSMRRAQGAVAEVKPLLQLPRAKQLIGAMEQQLREWNAHHDEMLKIAESDFVAATRIHDERVLPLAKVVNAAAEETLTLNQNLQKEKAEESEALVVRSRYLVIVLLLLAAAVGAVVFYATYAAIRGLTKVAGTMAAAAGQVSSAAQQVSSSSQALAQGASEQAAAVEETSASSEEITAITRSNLDGANTAQGLMTDAAAVVQRANEKLDAMVSSMTGITDASSKVSRINKVIDEIAFQTNILALNAAVEAARAGEAGMGFAVVADEVRNLAQRSAQAAKDTAQLIEESIARSEEGSGRLNEVGEAVREVTGLTGRLKTIVESVAGGSKQQAQGLDQITKAMGQIEQVTQQTAANAEETAAASEEMMSQSVAMMESVEALRKIVGGGESEVAGRISKPAPKAKLTSAVHG